MTRKAMVKAIDVHTGRQRMLPAAINSVKPMSIMYSAVVLVLVLVHVHVFVYESYDELTGPESGPAH